MISNIKNIYNIKIKKCLKTSSKKIKFLCKDTKKVIMMKMKRVMIMMKKRKMKSMRMIM